MRWALRVGIGYPFPLHIGDVIHLGNSTRAQVEDIRNQMKATGAFHDVVQLDDAGDVMHRLVTTNEHGGTPRHYCLDCGATRSGVHPPPPPCPGPTKETP